VRNPFIIGHDNQIKEDEVGGACSTYVEMRNACTVLVGKYEGKRPVGNPERRWEDSIKMGVKEIG
jgi:hypothetical protein